MEALIQQYLNRCLNLNKVHCERELSVSSSLQAYFWVLPLLKQAIMSVIQAGHTAFRQKRTAVHTQKEH